MRAVLLRPLINEKSMALIKQNLYTFEIDRSATKQDVEKKVKAKFNVDVLDVKTVTLKGKEKVQASRKGYFVTPLVKKAIVKVKEGQKIAIFEIAQADEEETQDVEVRTAEGEVVGKTKEKKSLLGGTKVKVERTTESKKENKEEKKK